MSQTTKAYSSDLLNAFLASFVDAGKAEAVRKFVESLEYDANVTDACPLSLLSEFHNRTNDFDGDDDNKPFGDDTNADDLRDYDHYGFDVPAQSSFLDTMSHSASRNQGQLPSFRSLDSTSLTAKRKDGPSPSNTSMDTMSPYAIGNEGNSPFKFVDLDVSPTRKKQRKPGAIPSDGTPISFHEYLKFVTDEIIPPSSCGMMSVALLVEEMFDTYDSQWKELDKLGPLSLDRMQHVYRLHVFFPSSLQLYCVRHLRRPHYQVSLHDLDAFVRFNIALHVELCLYNGESNHCNSVCAVFNDFTPEQFSKGDPTKFPFDEAIEFVMAQANVASKDEFHKTFRQRLFEDSGWTSPVCMSRNNDPTFEGVSTPHLKPGTEKFSMQYLSMTQIARAMAVPWTTELFHDDNFPDRQKLFASKIHSDNVFESARFHITSEDALLQCHSDRFNSNVVPFVFGITRISGNLRAGMTFYQRLSIDTTLQAMNYMWKLNHLVFETIENIPPTRWNVSSQMFSDRSVQSYYRFVHIAQVPCHLHPSAYRQMSLHCMLIMSKRFHLNLAGLVSLLSAAEIIPHNQFYFCSACVVMLHALRNKTFVPSHFTEYKIGFAVHLIMRVLIEQRVKRPKFRFSTYRPHRFLGNSEWVLLNNARLLLILSSWRYAASPKGESRKEKMYGHLSAMFQHCHHGTGPLVAMHMMAMASEVGLMPPWIRDYCEINNDPNDLIPSHALGCLKKKPTKEKTFRDLQTALTNRFGFQFTPAYVENIICKVKRLLSPKPDTNYADVFVVGQLLFYFEEDQIVIRYPMRAGDTNERHETLLQKALIVRFPMGNSLMTMEEIAGTVDGLPKIQTKMPDSVLANDLNGLLSYELLQTKSSVLVDYPVPNIGSTTVASPIRRDASELFESIRVEIGID